MVPRGLWAFCLHLTEEPATHGQLLRFKSDLVFLLRLVVPQGLWVSFEAVKVRPPLKHMQFEPWLGNQASLSLQRALAWP